MFFFSFPCVPNKVAAKRFASAEFPSHASYLDLEDDHEYSAEGAFFFPGFLLFGQPGREPLVYLQFCEAVA